ncbi:MAG: hypothetical protein JO362_18325 [Streptomycetaceae bacterium]|nr:hypothetical protein [Streptomycetaceae bacterium]
MTLRTLTTYPRRNPLTAGYLVLLVLTHLWLLLVSPAMARTVLLAVSTNVDNLAHEPVGPLLGSALFFDGTLTRINSLLFIGTLITLGLGIAQCLAWLERRWGARRAFALFLLGHVGATLLTAVIIEAALAHGWYPQSVRQSLDFGISYGAQAVLAATTFLLPKRVRPWWAVFVVAWPLGGAEWSGPLPDFTTVGHLIATALGFATGAAWLSRRSE